VIAGRTEQAQAIGFCGHDRLLIVVIVQTARSTGDFCDWYWLFVSNNASRVSIRCDGSGCLRPAMSYCECARLLEQPPAVLLRTFESFDQSSDSVRRGVGAAENRGDFPGRTAGALSGLTD
jgi:hypothetical protein